MYRVVALLLIVHPFVHCPAATADPTPWPLIIAHRGASGTLPEHTLEAYTLAIEQGAHFIEPDLIRTRDGVLVARHENELSDTTDAALKFPDRQTARTVDGREVTGWFVEDFTLKELKTMRAKERLPFRNQANNGKYTIPTFDEILALVQRESIRRGRQIGVYPETKHPTYFRARGLPLEEPLVEALNAAGLTAPEHWIFVQSFEVGNLKVLNTMTDVRLVQLLGWDEEAPYDQEVAGTGLTFGTMMADAGLAEIAAYADGIGPWKALIVPHDREGNPFPATDLISRAHAAGLVVHAYTFRNERRYLIKPYNADPTAEYRRFFALGLDGVFSDFPATALKVQP